MIEKKLEREYERSECVCLYTNATIIDKDALPKRAKKRSVNAKSRINPDFPSIAL